MRTGTLIPVEEYLNTSYDPDREYIDGFVVERNLGELDHSELQTQLSFALTARRKVLGIRVWVEQRVQVKPARFRVPDIAITVGPRPQGRVLVKPPLLCIEILSREDRVSDLQEKIDDYLEFGVSCVWVIDPRTRKAWIYTSEGAREAKDGILRISSPEILISLPEIYAELE